MSFLPALEMLAYYHAFYAAVPGRLPRRGLTSCRTGTCSWSTTGGWRGT